MPNHSMHDPIRLQASAWVSRLNRGLTDKEKPALIAWINQDPQHHKAIYKYASFFDDITQLEELNGIFPLEKNPTIWTPKVLLSILLVLFVAIVFTVTSLNWFKELNRPPSIQTFATNLGESRALTLPDGSEVLLNSASKISVDYSDDIRRIRLLYGEGQFNVAKNPNRPFIVDVGSKSFTALGTIFNIQKDNEMDMELVVTEGKVLITDSNLSSLQLRKKMRVEQEKANPRNIVTANEKVLIENKVKQRVTSLTKFQLAQTLAWQQGQLVFDGQTLTQVLEEVSRYTDVQFEILSPDVATLEVSGTFHTGDIDALLSSLENNFDIQSKFNATNSVQLSLKSYH